MNAGMDRCKSLLSRLQARYPDIGLSFGYIGNCGIGPGGQYDDRSWRYFTDVPDSCGTTFSLGSADTDHLEDLADLAEARLEAWIVETVLPRVEHVWRAFDVKVAWANAKTVERLLEQRGASFGSRGGGHFNFSARYMSLADLEILLAPWSPEYVRVAR